MRGALPEPDSPFSGSQVSFPPRMGWLLLTTLVVGLTTLAGSLAPFDFHAPANGPWLDVACSGLVGAATMIGLFVPFGFAEGWLVHNVVKFRNWLVLIVVLDAAVLSLIAETAQMWLPSRESSVVDLVANSFGAAVGALLADGFAPALNFRLWRH